LARGVQPEKHMTSPVDKFTIAAMLQEIGTLLELRGGDYFKARAYKRGARAIAEIDRDLGALIKQDRLTSVPGVGGALAAQIKEIYTTGKSALLEKLRSELPRGVVELSNVPGLNLKKIQLLQNELGISSIDDLKRAAIEGRVRQLKGFGIKTEQKLLEAIDTNEDRIDELHIHHALRLGERIVEYLRLAPSLIEINFAGALRRWRETVPEIEIVAATGRPSALIDHFVRFPLVLRVEEKSSQACAVILAESARASLLAVSKKNYPIALLRETGAIAHLKKLEQIAATKRLRFTDRGVAKLNAKRRESTKINFESEKAIYARLGMQYVPPELREDEGEIEAALAGRLPEDLIDVGDIQGMTHCHTTYSDGKHSIEEMARAAEAMGMKYITISDHSPTASYAGGLTIDRLKRQWDEIAEVQERVRIKILKATESDIVASGSLDYPSRILDQFDVIIASIHSRYKMNEDQMTQRIVKAMRQPWFKIWGHALGRLIQRRPPFACRVEEILDAIAESRAAIEVNGDPYRLDMEPRWLREARKRKIKFVISTDAHSIGALQNLKYGVGIARRGWIRQQEVLNTLPLSRFQKAVKPAQSPQ
jgi:DNA polymerase (family X)